MCRKTTCKTCGKPSWAGCGAHVEMVLGDVPKSQRCSCHERRDLGKASVKAHANATPPTSSFGKFRSWLQQ